ARLCLALKTNLPAKPTTVVLSDTQQDACFSPRFQPHQLAFHATRKQLYLLKPAVAGLDWPVSPPLSTPT
ncbi:hypothetical protein, partial [Actinoplanes awajinensis]|uniref:hypothetical protein n=1 Tax=Actinoplanes awajinensis TaxID=135946 RepID=UPI001E3198CB